MRRVACSHLVKMLAGAGAVIALVLAEAPRAWSQESADATLLRPLPPISTTTPRKPPSASEAEASTSRERDAPVLNRLSWDGTADQRRTRARPDGHDDPPKREAGGDDSPSISKVAYSQVEERDDVVPDYQDGVFALYPPVPEYLDLDITSTNSNRLKASFGPGFQLQTEDKAFRLQIHYESQVEARIWEQSDPVLPNSGVDGIYLPRQRIFFNGNITEPIEYEFSINRGVNGLNLLNAYINLHFDDRLEIRFGRFFTPMNYDQYAISNYWLLTPERSLFTTNVGLNRQFGLMAWGYLFDERLDYAAGVFNGSRNSFENTDGLMDFVTYINARPFQDDEALPALQCWNFGTSFAFGQQNQSPVPVAFRIGGGSPDTNIPGSATVPFLILNPDVLERGDRLLGSVHSAYFYKSLSLIGEWQYGYGNYVSPAVPDPAQVRYGGFYVMGGYFLTGEEIERRTRVKPLRSFVPLTKDEARGPGAWEVAWRVSQLSLGPEVFSDGFANPSLWSNRAVTTEVGTNWYWNEYTKIYAFWLHGAFGDTGQFGPGAVAKTADMFWLRFQLYF